jgi:cell cycle arrest protein BUB3
VVGTAGRSIWIYDIRNMAEPEQKRESSLKYQTRCIRTFPDATGRFAHASGA